MTVYARALTVGRATHPGRRRANQDWLGYFVPSRPEQLRAKGAMFAVADGFGAHGLWASRAAVETVIRSYYASPAPAVERSLVWAVQRANARLHAHVSQGGGAVRSGTTLTVAVVHGSHLYVAHVGDSRAYLLSGGRAQRLTRDHNFAAEEVARGGLTRQEARRHPWRHMLTRSIGSLPTVAVDVLRQRMQRGDVLVLCTDGLSERVTGRELPRFDGVRRAEEIAPLLVNVALRRGADDNATALVARVDGGRIQGAYQPLCRSPAAAPRAALMSILGLISGVAAGGMLLVLLMSLLAGT